MSTFFGLKQGQGQTRIDIVVTVVDGKFLMDGESQGVLELYEGNWYNFDVSDSSMETHPLRFSETSDGTHDSGSQYTNGYGFGGTAGNAGAFVKLIDPEPAPQLYYYCGAHSGMGGTANTNEKARFGGMLIDQTQTGRFRKVIAKDIVVGGQIYDGPYSQGINDFAYFTGGTLVSATPSAQRGVHPGSSDKIEKRYLMSGSGGATDIGELSDSIAYSSGSSSNKDGYVIGGFRFSDTGGSDGLVANNNFGVATMQRFQFASDTSSASSTGSLSTDLWRHTGHQSPTKGYTAGGVRMTSGVSDDYYTIDPTNNNPNWANNVTDIVSFSFASDTPVTDTGDLNNSVVAAAGFSTKDYGYVAGGSKSWVSVHHRNNTEPILASPGGDFGWEDQIDKFPFAHPAGTATDIGDMILSLSQTGGVCSEEQAVVFGGKHAGPPFTSLTAITFPFASEVSAVSNVIEWGNPFDNKMDVGTSAGKTYGVIAGGWNSFTSQYTTHADIYRFSFSTDQGYEDVGELTEPKQGITGFQF